MAGFESPIMAWTGTSGGAAATKRASDATSRVLRRGSRLHRLH
jgi:hypothetical protein